MRVAVCESGIPPWFISLAGSEAIKKEIDGFVAAVMASSGAAEGAAPAAPAAAAAAL
jgi:hypothetical protein